MRGLLLLLLAALSIMLTLLLPSAVMLQLRVLMVMIAGYLIWALSHHLHDKSLTLEVVMEYILTAALIAIILLGFLT